METINLDLIGAEALLGLGGAYCDTQAPQILPATGKRRRSTVHVGGEGSRPSSTSTNVAFFPPNKRSYTWRGIKIATTTTTTSLINITANNNTSTTTTTHTAAPASLSLPPSQEGAREWAALTTWLRMNTHHARTARKVVPFIGHRSTTNNTNDTTNTSSTSTWSFTLNPKISFQDLGEETISRMSLLSREAAAAFTNKYPTRPVEEWRNKAQKYRPPGSNQTWQVPLGEMVDSLQQLACDCINNGNGNNSGGGGECESRKEEKGCDAKDTAAVVVAPPATTTTTTTTSSNGGDLQVQTPSLSGEDN